MGGCQSEDAIRSNYDEPSKPEREKPNGPCLDPDFPDMPEWEGNKYKGIGIKRMKGYKCDLKIDELVKKRDEFWNIKCRGYDLWQVIQQACVYDEYRANLILEKYEIRCADGCINHLIDSNGNEYYIPNYCINDPYFEKELSEEEKNDEETLEIILYEVTKNINLKISISNHKTGKNLKDAFIKESKLPSNCKLRLFFSGMEIKDEHYLYQHKLKNEFKIQVMKMN